MFPFVTDGSASIDIVFVCTNWHCIEVMPAVILVKRLTTASDSVSDKTFPCGSAGNEDRINNRTNRNCFIIVLSYDQHATQNDKNQANPPIERDGFAKN